VSAHPDYAAADPADRWRGGDLPALFAALTGAATALPAGSWARRVLPHGAWVAVRYTDAGLRELRIYRREPPKTADGPRKWRAEVAVFAKRFGAGDWPVEWGEFHGAPLATLREPGRLL
jgi:hypothetical protein